MALIFLLKWYFWREIIGSFKNWSTNTEDQKKFLWICLECQRLSFFSIISLKLGFLCDIFGKTPKSRSFKALVTCHGAEIFVTRTMSKIAEFVINHEIWEHCLGLSPSVWIPCSISRNRWETNNERAALLRIWLTQWPPPPGREALVLRTQPAFWPFALGSQPNAHAAHAPASSR